MLLKAELYSGEILEYNVFQTSLIVGRSPKCDVVVSFEGVSRQHLKIQVKDGDIYLTDMGSINGVSINGERIEPDKKIKYQTFFTLSFGPVKNFQILFDQTMIIKAADLNGSLSDPAPKTKAPPISSLDKPALKAKPMFAKPIREKKKFGSMLINILAAAIILGVFFQVTRSRKRENKVEKKVFVPTKEDYF